MTDSTPRANDDLLARVDEKLSEVGYAQDQLIEVLHVAQDLFGHLPDEVLLHVAHALRLPLSRVYGVATFYHLFELTPPGEHSCTICTGTACFVEGADGIVHAVESHFDVHPGDTSADGRLTLRTARCLGSCGLAPCVVLDGDVLAHQRPEGTVAAITGAVGTESGHR